MIYYLFRKPHNYTVDNFIKSWQKDLISKFHFMAYEDLGKCKNFQGGTYIFSDRERLCGLREHIALEIWNRLAKHPDKFQLFNNPGKVLRRYELLKRLYEEGINTFQVYHLNEPISDIQFPVFIREENTHNGSLTPLIKDHKELSDSIKALKKRGFSKRELLIVEYLDTVDSQGMYRKYSVFIVKNKIVPRGILFDKQWVVKVPKTVTKAMAEEELQFVHSNPHEAVMQKVAKVSNIDYGRVDYSISQDNKVHVWEINTNPVVMLSPKNYEAVVMDTQEWFAKEIARVFESIDSHSEHIIDGGFSWKYRFAIHLRKKLSFYYRFLESRKASRISPDIWNEH